MKPCEREPLALPAGRQELLISPGAAFVVDGVQLTGPLGAELPSAATTPVRRARGGPITASCGVPPSQVSRVLVVPESINPGWTAHDRRRRTLTPVHRQRLAAGLGGAGGDVGNHHADRSRPTRCLPGRYRRRARAAAGAGAAGAGACATPAAARRPGAAVAAGPGRDGAALLVVGAVISGVVGVVVIGAALGVRYLLRGRPRR